VREIAALVTALLTHYGTTNEPAAVRRREMQDWLDDLVEFDVDIVADACTDWRRRPGGRRPTPGDIRSLCVERQSERNEARRLTDERATRWPAWLEDMWGPEPEGPQKRAAAILEAQRKSEVTNV